MRLWSHVRCRHFFKTLKKKVIVYIMVVAMKGSESKPTRQTHGHSYVGNVWMKDKRLITGLQQQDVKTHLVICPMGVISTRNRTKSIICRIKNSIIHRKLNNLSSFSSHSFWLSNLHPVLINTFVLAINSNFHAAGRMSFNKYPKPEDLEIPKKNLSPAYQT